MAAERYTTSSTRRSGRSYRKFMTGMLPTVKPPEFSGLSPYEERVYMRLPEKGRPLYMRKKMGLEWISNERFEELWYKEYPGKGSGGSGVAYYEDFLPLLRKDLDIHRRRLEHRVRSLESERQEDRRQQYEMQRATESRQDGFAWRWNYFTECPEYVSLMHRGLQDYLPACQTCIGERGRSHRVRGITSLSHKVNELEERRRNIRLRDMPDMAESRPTTASVTSEVTEVETRMQQEMASETAMQLREDCKLPQSLDDVSLGSIKDTAWSRIRPMVRKRQDRALFKKLQESTVLDQLILATAEYLSYLVVYEKHESQRKNAEHAKTVFLQVENPERDALQRKRKIRSRMLLERAEKSKLDIARAYGLLLIGGDRTWRKYHHQLDGQRYRRISQDELDLDVYEFLLDYLKEAMMLVYQEFNLAWVVSTVEKLFRPDCLPAPDHVYYDDTLPTLDVTGDRQPNLDNDISERLKVLSMPRLEGNPKSAQSQRPSRLLVKNAKQLSPLVSSLIQTLQPAAGQKPLLPVPTPARTRRDLQLKEPNVQRRNAPPTRYFLADREVSQ